MMNIWNEKDDISTDLINIKKICQNINHASTMGLRVCENKPKASEFHLPQNPALPENRIDSIRPTEAQLMESDSPVLTGAHTALCVSEEPQTDMVQRPSMLCFWCCCLKRQWLGSQPIRTEGGCSPHSHMHTRTGAWGQLFL